MFKSNYKFFIEINTFKIHVESILNRLRKQKDPNVINSIQVIIDGKSHDFISGEIALLEDLLNHPEHYIKNINTQSKINICAEVKEILETFILEINEEVVATRPGAHA
ncbi:hypothetical protein [Legionella sp. PC997]|uniref:hypothetical protein n=1 Tax=Legionella sp. PC997 TaxID=2755562 RepID=UPI0015FCAFE4|nr:hypothetical protein [Legionella sp. PC997]QMT60900.1 hypothetical protein HBNCFIEN_02289 [Legionella sp. PC997]